MRKTLDAALRKLDVFRSKKQPWHTDPGLRERLAELLSAAHSPVCIIDYRTSGGSAVFGRRKAEELLGQGRAVLYLVHERRKGLIRAAAMRGGDAVEFSMRSLSLLADVSFPRFAVFSVNEVVNWAMPRLRDPDWRANGRGRSRLVGAVLRQIVALARLHGARLEFFAHDFYSVCPSPHLLDRFGDFCGIPADLRVCADCMPITRHHRGVSLPRWREDWQFFLDNTDQVSIFSDSARSYLQRVFTLEHDKVIVQPIPPMTAFSRTVRLPAGGPMVVAVVGRIDYHKGSRIVMELSNFFADQSPECRIVVFGTLDTGYVPDNITVTGPYEREKLPDLLEEHGCTIGLFPSIWPETFSLVTQELMQIGLPLVCFPLGAPADRVGAWEKGMVAADISAAAALNALVALDDERRTRRSALPRTGCAP